MDLRDIIVSSRFTYCFKICILLADVNKREINRCMYSEIGQMEIIFSYLFIFLLTQNTVKIQL